MSGEKPLSLTPLKMGQHKMKTKKKQFKAVSQKVKLFRSKDPLISVLSWGVNHTINELSRVNVPVMLLPDDFKAHSKIRVDNHLYNKENLPSHFKFKEYCPLVFKNLRERFCVDDQMYYKSFQVPLLTAGSPGRSGANFFLSQDKRFYVKQLESEEVERLHNLLPQYHQYIVERHAKTLLPHYLGMYRVTVDSKETYLFVMRNVFSGQHKVHKKYDLKGSTVDRQASDKEKTKEFPTYKDLDFCKDNVKITVSEEDKIELMDRVKADVEFLASLNIMDYSLLLGIHDPDRGDDEEEEDEDEVDDDQMRSDSNDDSECDSPSEMMVVTSPSVLVPQTPETPPPDSPSRIRTISFGSNGDDVEPSDEEVFSIPSSIEGHKEIYFMGIVDVLTYYGATKKAAHAAKTVKHGAGAEISTVKPETYAKRFLEFVDKIVE